jgi:hypothetical protein
MRKTHLGITAYSTVLFYTHPQLLDPLTPFEPGSRCLHRHILCTPKAPDSLPFGLGSRYVVAPRHTTPHTIKCTCVANKHESGCFLKRSKSTCGSFVPTFHNPSWPQQRGDLNLQLHAMLPPHPYDPTTHVFLSIIIVPHMYS